MASAGARGGLAILLILSIILSILVIPGVGFETRSLSAFPSWQQMLFMDGGPAVIILSLLAVGLLFGWPRAGGGIGFLAGLGALTLSGVGLALLGAPSAPMAVVGIDAVHLLVALGILGLASMNMRSEPMSSAPMTQP